MYAFRDSFKLIHHIKTKHLLLTSQLNSKSASIVTTVTLKVLACFLRRELRPIFDARTLAIIAANGKPSSSLETT